MIKNFLAVLAILFSLTAAPVQRKASANAPAEDYSGMYSFLQEGEFVQLTLESQGRVTGYISRMGDLPSDRGAFLDQFFKTATLEGKKLTFQTEQVHGVWFEFRGTVGRGPAKTPSEDGYYELRGTLLRYATDAEKKTTAQSREVVFKFLGMPPDADSGPRNRN